MLAADATYAAYLERCAAEGLCPLSERGHWIACRGITHAEASRVMRIAAGRQYDGWHDDQPD